MLDSLVHNVIEYESPQLWRIASILYCDKFNPDTLETPSLLFAVYIQFNKFVKITNLNDKWNYIIDCWQEKTLNIIGDAPIPLTERLNENKYIKISTDGKILIKQNCKVLIFAQISGSAKDNRLWVHLRKKFFKQRGL